ncbi:MAG: hypothetical protein H6662_19700 [Ardenticatenaceae bacterium]|nr:hypothetical protein [Ardenticatenaceae bacterium]MCB8990143.1 hypothetical protein [Ardenticatenaceae bacterium]
MTEDKGFVEKGMEKNMELWEKWTGAYMDTMFKAMDKTMQQSSVFQEQVNRAVSAAVHAQSAAMMTSLQTMQDQLEKLTNKVDEFLHADE